MGCYDCAILAGATINGTAFDARGIRIRPAASAFGNGTAGNSTSSAATANSTSSAATSSGFGAALPLGADGTFNSTGLVGACWFRAFAIWLRA